MKSSLLHIEDLIALQAFFAAHCQPYRLCAPTSSLRFSFEYQHPASSSFRNSEATSLAASTRFIHSYAFLCVRPERTGPSKSCLVQHLFPFIPHLKNSICDSIVLPCVRKIDRNLLKPFAYGLTGDRMLVVQRSQKSKFYKYSALVLKMLLKLSIWCYVPQSLWYCFQHKNIACLRKP